jgi:hypothetical protein
MAMTAMKQHGRCDPPANCAATRSMSACER